MKVLIDSKFRETGTIDEYKFLLPHPIKKVREIRLLQSVLPNSIYQIDTGYNSFSFTISSGTPETKTITLSSGNYTGSQLAAQITTQLNATMSIADFTVTYNNKTNKLTTTKGTGTWSYEPTLNKEIREILGISSTGSGEQSTNWEHTNMIDLSFPRHIFIDVNTGSTNTNDVMTKADAHSFAVNLNGDPYTIDITSSLADYLQVENNNNNDARSISVKLHLPTTSDTIPNFNGLHHQLLLELI
jgi:hypothetical protein